MRTDATIDASEATSMRTTISLDDELLSKAHDLTGIKEKSAILREGLKALIERESARRLALIGGIAPDFNVPPRKRPLK